MPPVRRCLLGRGGRRRRHPGRGSLAAPRGRFCSRDQSNVGPNSGSLGGPVAYLSVSLPQATNGSLAVGDRSTQLVIHDAMQRRPTHLPNAYSPECVEEEFCELRLLSILRSSHTRSSRKFTLKADPPLDHRFGRLSGSYRICVAVHYLLPPGCGPLQHFSERFTLSEKCALSIQSVQKA